MSAESGTLVFSTNLAPTEISVMNWQPRRKAFREVLNANRCVYPGSVYDPISARIAENVGFEIGMFAGSIASLAVLGDPDHILITLSEFADQAYRINRASSIPLMVDADHGYGNALNVMRTVQELENAGVSGLSIEDTDLPLAFGSGGKARLLALEEGAKKMKAAVEARSDTGVAIAARTSAPLLANLDDTLARVQAYQECGVDALFLIGVKTRADLDRISETANLPIILGGAGEELKDLDYLSSKGVRICLQGHQPFMAAVQACYSTLRSLRDGVSPAQLEGLPDKTLLRDLDRSEKFDQWIEDYLQ